MLKKFEHKAIAILIFSLGNFAFYVPYTLFTKLYSTGAFGSGNFARPSAFELLPLFAVGQVITLSAFIIGSGWWRYARSISVFGLKLPCPRFFTFLSGMCTIGQIITGLLAYSFEGISIVFAALLMKGGTLVLAPVVDRVAKKRRAIFWPSWMAASLSLIALIAASAGQASLTLTLICLVDILLYLIFYFSKLMIMSTFSKSGAAHDKRSYIAEEEMVIALGLIVIFLVLGMVGANLTGDNVFTRIWYGWKVLPFQQYFYVPLLIGLCTSLAGVCAMMVFLDRRENTFCVATNQSVGLIAGTTASFILAVFFDFPYPGVNKLSGAFLVILSIFFLSYHSVIERRIRKLGGASI